MANTTFVKDRAMPVSAQELFDWHARPSSFLRLVPPWEKMELVSIEGSFGVGQKLTMRTNILGPISKAMVAEITEVEPGDHFKDRQLTGPFAEWEHTHRMIAGEPEASATDTNNSSILEDSIDYRVPLGILGRAFGSGMVTNRLEQMFAYRHDVTASDLRRSAKFKDKPRLTVAITGSHGLIGTSLCHMLVGDNHKVIRLVRGEPKPSRFDDGTTQRKWNPQEKVPAGMLDGVDVLVHLAGESLVDGRWTKSKKEAIRNSRIIPTDHLGDAIRERHRDMKAFITASAIGYYGDRGNEIMDEESHPGEGFLPDVCKGWERTTDDVAKAGVRVVNVRTGIVLSAKGGALAKQLTAFKTGGGAKLGNGKQWISWISLHDMIGIYHQAILDDSLHGPIVATAPNPVTNRDFGRTLATVLGRPYLLTVPKSALRILFGQMADDALLASTRALPKKLEAEGFTFEHPKLEEALRFCLGRRELG